jgi:hypothetical protein
MHRPDVAPTTAMASPAAGSFRHVSFLSIMKKERHAQEKIVRLFRFP